jgi:pimeloyl-ACP methyl ester carboxylesterase
MNSIPVSTDTWLNASYTMHEAKNPAHQKSVVFQHGYAHGSEQFEDVVRYLNKDHQINAATIDLQSDHAGWLRRNLTTINQYVRAHAATVMRMEIARANIGSYVNHSMGNVIGELMQEKYPELRRPTVMIAPVPVQGAIGVTLRTIRKHPVQYAKALAALDTSVLMKEPEQVRELFFDAKADEGIVQDTTKQLHPAPFAAYAQLGMRWTNKRLNAGSPRKIIINETDAVFMPYEYKETQELYADMQKATIFPEGGHDFFIEHAKEVAGSIAAFHMERS